MTKSQFLLGSALALTLIACSDDPETSTGSSDDENVQALAIVDGRPINELDVTLHLQQRQQEGQAVNLSEVIEELVNLKVVAVNAEKDGYLEREDIKAELRRQHDGILANAYIQEKVQGIEVTDDDLKEEYDRQMAKLSEHEYSASHILTESREDALAALARVEAGDEFGRVANEQSTGPSAENGGELGWFRPESMVPEFSAALETLEEGEHTKEPVKTSFGWHIIRLTGKRPVVRPEFEKIKEHLRTLVVNNRLNDFVQDLRKKSEVEIKQ